MRRLDATDDAESSPVREMSVSLQTAMHVLDEFARICMSKDKEKNVFANSLSTGKTSLKFL